MSVAGAASIGMFGAAISLFVIFSLLRDSGGERGKMASVTASIFVLTAATAARAEITGKPWWIGPLLGSALAVSLILGTAFDPMNAVTNWPGLGKSRVSRPLRPTASGPTRGVERRPSARVSIALFVALAVAIFLVVPGA